LAFANGQVEAGAHRPPTDVDVDVGVEEDLSTMIFFLVDRQRKRCVILLVDLFGERDVVAKQRPELHRRFTSAPLNPPL
jgi:hypothetical protein